jgi:hypothetical protein
VFPFFRSIYLVCGWIEDVMLQIDSMMALVLPFNLLHQRVVEHATRARRAYLGLPDGNSP